MARQKRIYFNSAVYHIVFRGNNRQMILKEARDKVALLDTIAKYRQRFGFKLHGFVLMDNHVHLVLGADRNNNISKIMQSILLSYSLKFRKKYNYCGHVWQGRFKSKIIDGDAHVRECLEYIHNNPVRANMVDSPKSYFWSSCHFHEGFYNEILADKIELNKYGDTSNITN